MKKPKKPLERNEEEWDSLADIESEKIMALQDEEFIKRFKELLDEHEI